ncbi:hypothetical protein ABZ890_39660 [Streptomyces sp. NPDC046984]
MDGMGAAPTNDPRVTVLWEREGRTVRLGLEVEPEDPPRFTLTLPHKS